MIGFNADQSSWVDSMVAYDLHVKADFRIYVNLDGSITYIRAKHEYVHELELEVRAYCRQASGRTMWAFSRVDAMLLRNGPTWVLEECFKQLRHKVEHML